MKYEWKKEEKDIYMPKNKVSLVEVPKYRYFMIKGKGNPNEKDFSDRIEVLYRLSYSIKMMPKRGFIPGGYFEYSVYPLEAVWNKAEVDETGKVADKDKMEYTLMIRQPEFVTESIARMTVTNIISTNPHPLINEVNFASVEDGLSIQVMHLGTYDSENESFDKLKAFAEDNKLTIDYSSHREIYISNAKRTAPEKLKTVLRYKIKR